jgi:hypothetical protein
MLRLKPPHQEREQGYHPAGGQPGNDKPIPSAHDAHERVATGRQRGCAATPQNGPIGRCTDHVWARRRDRHAAGRPLRRHDLGQRFVWPISPAPSPSARTAHLIPRPQPRSAGIGTNAFSAPLPTARVCRGSTWPRATRLEARPASPIASTMARPVWTGCPRILLRGQANRHTDGNLEKPASPVTTAQTVQVARRRKEARDGPFGSRNDLTN